MTYTYNCAACSKPTVVEADNDDDAVNKIVELGKKHQEEVHPEWKGECDEMVRTVRGLMTKS